MRVDVLRIDLIHPEVSGNKWFKLKYNLEEAQKLGLKTILTFGGAFSNHISATAAACNLLGLKSIGVIRGEESAAENPTLSEARKAGMQLHFVSREEYRKKNDEAFISELKDKFGDVYMVPEGGNNFSGALGCTEILKDINDHDLIFCACGTATTFAGLSKQIGPHQNLIGISVLKGDHSKIHQDSKAGKRNMLEEAQELVNMIREKPDLKICSNDEVLASETICRSGILSTYTFGGYARHTDELIRFKTDFEKEYNVPLDYVYTAKLFYAVFDLIQKGKIPENSRVLIIHSGGLQGNKGYEQRYNLNPNL